MEKLKKIIVVFLMMFALSFAFACGKEDETDDNKQNQTVEYTVTFVANGEETKQTVKEGEKAVKPADPEKEGYTFVGWYVGDAEYAFDAVTADVTVTAKFEEIVYTVKFVVDGAEEIQTVKVGEKATKPADPEKLGHEFLGWFVGSEAYDFGVVNADVTVEGKFSDHVFDQCVMEDKYLDQTSGNFYYKSCICGEKGTEKFANPEEVTVTVADDDIAKLSVGDEYSYNGEKYVVGLTAFADINEAIEYATETVYIADGEYNDIVTITKSNLKILGNNANINPNIATRKEESVLTNKLKLNKDVENIVVSGLYFTLDAQFLGNAKGGNNNLVFEYNVFDNEITAQTGYPNGGEFMLNPSLGYFNKNCTVQYNRFLSTGGKTYHLFFKNIEELKVYGNYFEGTYAQVYADSIIFDDTSDYGATGNIVIENNEFVNICQYAIVFWDYCDVQLKVIGNKFKNCGVDGANDGYIRAAVTLVLAQLKNENTTVLVEKNEMENVDALVRVQYANMTAEKVKVDVKDNIFISWAEPQPITNNGEGKEALINAEYNYFGQEVTDESFKGVTSWANKYENIDDVPKYERDDLIYVTDLEITNKVAELPAYSDYKLEYSYAPNNATYTKIVFKSSDESVATVNDRGTIKVLGSGKVTIYACCVFDETICDSFEFTVKERSMVDVLYEGNGVLKPDDTVMLNVFIKGVDNPGKVEFISSDPTIATVDEDGLVTGVGKGLVVITVKCGDLETEVGFTVLGKDQEFSELMQLLIENNSGRIFYDVINYIGYEEGFESVAHKVYGAANAYWAGEAPEIIENMLPESNENYTGQTMTSIEYVVLHDTGAANPGATAEANSGWCVNPSNTGTAWHYTTGNDGIYKQLEDNIVAWHAGDWSQRDPGKFAWYDTGIKYEVDRPTVTIEDDGYFYINGAKTIIEAPRKEDGSIEKNINQVGLVCVKGENGNYMIPTTWISDESGYPVCSYGGNSNGIGIESCVNTNSDLWLTWQYTSKLIAELLVKHNLNADRLVFHNNFTNKTCPNTMITNGLVDEFLELVYAEYEVAKNYSDYEIKFTSHNPDIMDNTGRIINAPDYNTNVTYTITITKDGVSEEVTLNVLVPGRFGLK